MAARSLTITLIFSLVILPIMGAFSAERLKLSSTTSTDNTGLLSYLLPVFEDRTGIHVDVIAGLRTVTSTSLSFMLPLGKKRSWKPDMVSTTDRLWPTTLSSQDRRMTRLAFVLPLRLLRPLR
jgi:hypothetical protein